MKKFILTASLLLSTQTFAAPPGVIMLGGGGPEGDVGVTTDWSYPLYKRMLENGDINGDGKIKVVVLSLAKPDTNFMVDYLKWLGGTTTENLVVDSRERANDPKLVDTLVDADVLFIRGGNQAKAYRFWKDTRLHSHIEALYKNKGAIGGTSSGSMILSEYAITGGQDFDSKDVLQDAKTPLLNDELNPRLSGISKDFLDMVPGALVDTHCGERGRIGRILGAQAKAVEDYKDDKILSICLEEKTGIAISQGVAQVYGTGAAHFLQETEKTKTIREAGEPLVYTDIRNDMLTDGWFYDMNKREPDLSRLPKSAEKIEEKEYAQDLMMTNNAFSEDAFATGEKKKGVYQTLSFKKIHDHPRNAVVLLDSDSKLKPMGERKIASVNRTTFLFIKAREMGSLVFDCQWCSYKSLSPFVSSQDTGLHTLHSPGMVNMRIHVLSGDTAVYDFKKRELEVEEQD